MAVSVAAAGTWMGSKRMYTGGDRRGKICCAAVDPYKTLRIKPSASESEVKKAFRQLVLKYHPDVCKGSNCNVQFSTINEAYDIVISNLRNKPKEQPKRKTYGESVEPVPFSGVYDPDDLWEEWMGWEGAGIRDYSSHINPYI